MILADEATALLHGRDCLKAIHETIDTMFKGGEGAASTESLNRIFVTEEDVANGDGVKIIDLFVRLGLATSKKEARRLIQGGGAKLNEVKVEDENAVVAKTDFNESKEVTLRAGKKRAGVVELN